MVEFLLTPPLSVWRPQDPDSQSSQSQLDVSLSLQEREKVCPH